MPWKWPWPQMPAWLWIRRLCPFCPARDGLIPAGSHLNRKHWACSTLVEPGVDEALESVTFDAQTSGGLLLAVPPDLLGPVRDMLESGGDLAREVGEVLPPRTDGKALLLR